MPIRFGKQRSAAPIHESKQLALAATTAGTVIGKALANGERVERDQVVAIIADHGGSSKPVCSPHRGWVISAVEPGTEVVEGQVLLTYFRA